MFLKSATVRGKEYIRIVQSYRNKDNKVKHKTVVNLGSTDNLVKMYPFFDKLIKKYMSDRYTAIDYINKDGNADIVNYGYIVIKDIWSRYRLSDFFKTVFKRYKIEFNITKTIFSLVINRALKSELSKRGYFNNKDIFLMLNEELKHQDLYKSLDYLSDIKEELEQHLLKTSINLFNRDISVALYDVTTLYFESKKEDECIRDKDNNIIQKGLKQFGLSKEFKPNDTQILLSLLLDTNGMPITFDIYEGNKAETKTLLDSLDRLKKKFSLEKVTIIADRGISSSLNLYEIKQRGYEYIVAIRYKGNKELEKEVLDRQNYTQISYSTNKGYYGYKEFIVNETKTIKAYEGYSLYEELTNNNSSINIKTDSKNQRYIDTTITLTHKIISTYSNIRANKDKSDRDRAIDKLNRKIQNNSLKTKTNEKYLKQVIINNKQDNNCDYSISYEIDLSKIEHDAKYDGFYTLASSDASLDALMAIQRHKTIYDIENAFRELKTNLNIRPIYHWTYKRIRGHIIVSFLSYFLLKNIEYKLSNNKKIISYLKETKQSLSLKKIVDSLNEINLLKTDINNKDYYIKLKHSTLTSKILDVLKIKSPKHILDNKELKEYMNDYKHINKTQQQSKLKSKGLQPTLF